jgi:photosystem II stability/assembly factor-like uncharacterized protein
VANVPVTVDLHGVTDGPDQRFWAVGTGGTILRSLPNPLDPWTVIGEEVTTEDLNAITFFGSIGIAVGNNGTILYSNGGSTWAQVDSPTTARLNGVGYTGSGQGGGFVAVGEGQTVIWSQLGTIWTDAVVPVRNASWGSIRGRWNAPPSRR